MFRLKDCRLVRFLKHPSVLHLGLIALGGISQLGYISNLRGRFNQTEFIQLLLVLGYPLISVFSDFGAYNRITYAFSRRNRLGTEELKRQLHSIAYAIKVAVCNCAAGAIILLIPGLRNFGIFWLLNGLIILGFASTVASRAQGNVLRSIFFANFQWPLSLVVQTTLFRLTEPNWTEQAFLPMICMASITWFHLLLWLKHDPNRKIVQALKFDWLATQVKNHGKTNWLFFVISVPMPIFVQGDRFILEYLGAGKRLEGFLIYATIFSGLTSVLGVSYSIAISKNLNSYEISGDSHKNSRGEVIKVGIMLTLVYVTSVPLVSTLFFPGIESSDELLFLFGLNLLIFSTFYELSAKSSQEKYLRIRAICLWVHLFLWIALAFLLFPFLNIYTTLINSVLLLATHCVFLELLAKRAGIQEKKLSLNQFENMRNIQHLIKKKLRSSTLIVEFFMQKAFQVWPVGNRAYYFAYKGQSEDPTISYLFALHREFFGEVKRGNYRVPRNSHHTRNRMKAWIKHQFLLATSQVLVTNVDLARTFYKRRDQVIFQVWHGHPIKRLGADRLGLLHNSRYSNVLKNQALNWDCMISSGEYETRIFRSALQFEGLVLELGSIRQLALLEAIGKDNFRKQGNIPRITYAPSWREDHEEEFPEFNPLLTSQQLAGEFPNCEVVLRTHHDWKKEQLEPSLTNLCDGKEMRQSALFESTDVLVTDYSSIAFDFAVLGKPIIFYVPDYSRYIESPGLYFNLIEELPNSCAFNLDSLRYLVDLALRNPTSFLADGERLRMRIKTAEKANLVKTFGELVNLKEKHHPSFR